MRDGSVREIETSVRELLARRNRLVLAVSGGVDSAVLLDAIARLRGPSHHVVVVSVDHGTGEAATESTARVLATAAQFGLPAISERLFSARADEASWRAGRWAFLRSVAKAEEAPVVTGHTLNDHIETVVMRIMRGASARGLAGLLAISNIERPLLAHERAAILSYAQHHKVSFTEDPTNESRTFLRNRIRLDLLPAIRRVRPGFEREILRLSREAAEVRINVDGLAGDYILQSPNEGALLLLDVPALTDLPDESLRLLLPAILARAGITLDRRGLVRLADVVRASPGSSGQISGGFQAVRSRGQVAIVCLPQTSPTTLRLRPSGETRFGGFRFLAEPAASIRISESTVDNPWRIYIPKSVEPVVRQWNPGDRLTTDLNGGRRRVKRFFADAGIAGPLRAGWPVVVCGEDVIWIPGVKASQTAVRRGGRMVHYTCERVRD
jgi:tRNA(Ile)-lysidine synthase